MAALRGKDFPSFPRRGGTPFLPRRARGSCAVTLWLLKLRIPAVCSATRPFSSAY